MVYKIPKEKRVLKAFEYAKEEIPEIIRLEDLRKICNRNLENWKVPIQYQYLWYCLHGLRISRKFENGRITDSKVSFHTISIELNNKLIKLVKQTINKVGIDRFAFLCNVSDYTIKSWLNRIYKTQITCIFKACQILNKDPWKILNNCKLYGWCHTNYFLFKIKESDELLDLIPWIANEGHMAIDDPTINIKQHKDGLSALKELVKVCNKLNINTNLNALKGKEFNLNMLTIYSASLRQILVLRYNMDIGYKCRTVNFDIKNLNKNQKLRVLARDLETDGCFTTDLRNGIRYPKYDFCSQSYDNVYRVYSTLKELGYNPMKITFTAEAYRVTLKKLKENIKLAYEIYPYLIHNGRKTSLIKSISEPKLMSHIRFDNFKLLDKAIQKDPFLYEKLNVTKKFMNYWKYRDTSPPLNMLIKIAELQNKNLYKYIPKWFKFLEDIHENNSQSL
ncbi:MAG: hypothetical protein PHF86_12690 [Candidatus Nanoarchaeia archaeon]|nr:hypothetical protein [Candidatus Nanoarchaeia archaeon]